MSAEAISGGRGSNRAVSGSSPGTTSAKVKDGWDLPLDVVGIGRRN
jgi:hypothetical protein